MVNYKLVPILILFAVCIVSSIAEDRDIYLVLLEGEPVAFHEKTHHKQAKKPRLNR